MRVSAGSGADPFADGDRVDPYSAELWGAVHSVGEHAAAIRTMRDTAGTAIPLPHVIDDDARWHYWFAPNGRFRKNVEEDRDNVILFKGPAGCGKSTLSLRAARSLYPDIDAANLAQHIGFNVRQFTQLILESRDTYVALDEAVVGGGSLDVHSPEAKFLVETVNTMRWRHNTVALLIPNADDLLKALRVRRCEFHISCTHTPKGTAVVRTKNWQLERPLKQGDLGLRTDWRFNPISWQPFAADDPLWVEYLRLKQEADDRRARRGLALLQSQETFTTGQAARNLGVSARTLRSWVETGRVRSVTTPGGQHRVTEAELRRIGTQLSGGKGESGKDGGQ